MLHYFLLRDFVPLLLTHKNAQLDTTFPSATQIHTHTHTEKDISIQAGRLRVKTSDWCW